jgi:hypothetical protein
MLEKGLPSDCSVAALAAFARIQAHATMNDEQVRDLRNLAGVSLTIAAFQGGQY